MLSIPSAILQELHALSSTGSVLFLVSIPAQDIYLARNTEDVIWNSKTYQKFWFELDGITIDSDGKLPEISISVDNVNRLIQYYIEQADGFIGETLNLYIVNSNHLDVATPIYQMEFTVIGAPYDPKKVTFKLGMENPFYLKYPANSYHQNLCRYRVFKDSVQCRYSGAGSTCDRRWVTCVAYGNQARFGGQPGLIGTLLDEEYVSGTGGISGDRYTLGSNGVTITDSETGLVWQRTKHTSQLYYDAAVAYCDELVLGGFSDWRLPTRSELINLCDYTEYRPAMPSIFTDITTTSTHSTFVSITEYADRPDTNWYIEYVNGVSYWCRKEATFNWVRAVRGTQRPAAADRLVANTTNTVKDTSTGLVWQKTGTPITYQTITEAAAYCAALSLDGYTDWRLPTIYELESIVDYTEDEPAWGSLFDGGYADAGEYWSSTVYAGQGAFHWGIRFAYSGIIEKFIDGNGNAYVRAVRED